MRVSNAVGIVLAAGMLFLLGASAQAAVVFDPNDATKAIGIENLQISDFGLYNVEFTGLHSAAVTYGLFPGNLDFNTDGGTLEAIDATNAALNTEGGVLGVGDDALANPSPIYLIGFEVELIIGADDRITVYPGTATGDSWSRGRLESLPYNNADRVWATFTLVPEPVPLMHPTVIYILLPSLLGGVGLLALRKRS